MLDVIILGMFIPLMLCIFCSIIFVMQRVMKKKTGEELKNYYWLKTSNKNEKVEEKGYDMQNIILEIIFYNILYFFGLTVLGVLDLYNFNALKVFITSEAFWNILGLNIDMMAVISLIIVLKKDYYLGITVKEVMKVYKIQKHVIKVVLCSVILFFLYGFYNVVPIIENEIYSLLVELIIYAFIIDFVVNLILLIWKTIILCLNDNKKEMQTYKCLRYKINFRTRLRPDEYISGNAVEKISLYLVSEIIKKYKYFNETSEKLKNVQYGSAMLIMETDTKEAKEINNIFRMQGAIRVFIVSIMYWISIALLQYEKANESKCFWYLVGMEIILILIIIFIGALLNVWNIFSSNRSFWIFNYENVKHKKIATVGFVRKYNKRYEFVGAIEDLLGFYKMLLYNEIGGVEKNILIEKVKDKLSNKEVAKIRNTILLLLFYFEYEKYYLESQEEVERSNKLKEKEKLIKKKTKNKMRKNSQYFCEEVITWMKNMNEESVEYKLADSILKHVYKEPEIENGNIVPEKLRNYRFEQYFKFIEEVGNKFSEYQK